MESLIKYVIIEEAVLKMKIHKRYQAYYEPANSPITVTYEFDTEIEMKNSGLIDDPRRTTCYMSRGKYYVGGHFENEGDKKYD